MALRDQPYLPLYVQDFITDEKLVECSASATGVYIRIMCLMHKSEVYGTIALSEKDIAQCEHSSIIEMFAHKLTKFFPYTFETIKNGIIELVEERVLYIAGTSLCQKRMIKDSRLSELRAGAGKKGAAKKYAKDSSRAKPMANEQYNNTSLETPELSFDAVWNLYDKKVGDKRKLKKKWNSLNTEKKLMILDYIPKYIASQPDKQFRKNFETFLNNQSWEDEIINDNGRKQTTATESRFGEVQTPATGAKTFKTTL